MDQKDSPETPATDARIKSDQSGHDDFGELVSVRTIGLNLGKWPKDMGQAMSDYEADILEWSEHQATLLRRMRPVSW
jgi:hypothetical protein